MDPANALIPFFPALGAVAALLCVIGAMRSGRRQRLVDNLPTSKTTGVFIGLVELNGTAESDAPLTSHLAGVPCVHHAWTVEEKWSRTVTETYRDSDGKMKTRTRHESGWTTLDSGGETIPFYLKDDCGTILIQPDGAELEPQDVFSETCSRSDPLYYSKGPAQAIAHSDHIRRFVEDAISLHAPLYVIGQARERKDVVAAEVAKDKNAPMFLISTRSEKEVSRGFHWAFWIWCFFGLLLAVGGFVARDAAMDIDPKTNWQAYLLPAAGYLVACALGWVWMVYNALVELSHRVRQGWGQVDIQLKRRHDLIPRLVETVTGLRGYETNLQVELAHLRGQLQATPPGKAGADPRACANTLVVISERYPQLQAQEAFLKLQRALADTEQRIALARGYFNEIATFFNTRLVQVPERYVAGLARLKPQALMEANDFERAPVEVKLAG